jgi:hypothetical protein
MASIAGVGFGRVDWLPGAVRVAYTAGDPGPGPLPFSARRGWIGIIRPTLLGSGDIWRRMIEV